MAVSDHEAKMFTLQQQVRQNQSELDDFLKDMNSWEEDIKKKEKNITKQKVEKNNVDLPPVRNCVFKKKKKKVVKSVDKAEKPKRISGYDYRKWDKFDVNKELEKMEEKQESESSEYETDEEWEMERKKQMANIEKEKGNDYFKRQDYELAIEAYTKAIELDPVNAILPANRAMALLKQEKYGAAETDCLHSLSLDPLYVKAYLRLGAARFELKKLDLAKQAFEKALKLEPQNKTALKELDRIDKEKTKDKMVEQKESTISPGIVKAITKAPNQRSQKPLLRLHIEEIGGDDGTQIKAAIEKVQKSQSETKKQITTKDNQMFEKFTSGKSDSDKLSDKSESIINSQNDETIPSQSSVCDKTSTVKTNVEKDLNNLSEKCEESPRSMPIPQSSFQFQTDYKVLKNDIQSFYYYVRKINPEDYPKLFGQFLDAGILLNMLNTFNNYFIPAGEDFYSHMVCLAKVKRFNMTVMFFSKKEQTVIKDLIAHLEKSGNVTSADLQKLKKTYEIS